MPSSQGELTRAVRYTHILAAVNVNAIAVGIDFEVVDGQVVDSCEQQAEVAALEKGEVLEDDIVAVLEGDGLVADAGLFGPSRPDSYR